MSDDSWTFLDSRRIAEYRVLCLRGDRYRFEPTKTEAEFAICESADWVLVIPITDDGRIVFIRQFRHGVQEVVLEIPGGLLDGDETPEAAGVRELREETGYSARQVRYLGRLFPNPALNTASCHVCVAQGCHRTGEQEPDLFEQIEVVLHPLDSVHELVRAGKLCHAQVIAAFALKEMQEF